MKKRSFILAMFLIFSTVLLSACGVQGSTQVVGVKFSTERLVSFDGRQVKCFMLDVGEEFNIPYQIFPNTATEDANVVFSHKADNRYNNTFNFIDGKFQILNSNFPEEGVLVNIVVNSEHTDECLIKKVKYPESNLKGDTEDIIYQNATYVFSVVDDYGKSIDVTKYNFCIESSDESVVKIENNDSLIVKSTGKRGASKITVSYVSDAGKKYKIGEKTLTVLMNAVDSKIVIDGNIVNMQNLNIVLDKDQNGDAIPKDMDVSVYLIDSEGFEITGFDYEIKIISGSAITVNEKRITLHHSGNKELKCIIEIVTKALDSNGSHVKIRLNINVTKET